MPKLTEVQSAALRALGLIVLEVPAAKRSVLNNEIRVLLEAVGLDYTNHLYLLGERFRSMLPGSLSINARRQFYFEVLRGAVEEQPDIDYEWRGMASVDELAQVLGRSGKTIANWLTDKHRLSHNKFWVLAGVPTSFSGAHLYFIRYHKMQSGEAVPELDNGVTIYEAMDELVKRHRIGRVGKY